MDDRTEYTDHRPDIRSDKEIRSLTNSICIQHGFGNTIRSREEFRQGVIDALYKRPATKQNKSYVAGYELGNSH